MGTSHPNHLCRRLQHRQASGCSFGWVHGGCLLAQHVDLEHSHSCLHDACGPHLPEAASGRCPQVQAGCVALCRLECQYWRYCHSSRHSHEWYLLGPVLGLVAQRRRVPLRHFRLCRPALGTDSALHPLVQHLRLLRVVQQDQNCHQHRDISSDAPRFRPHDLRGNHSLFGFGGLGGPLVHCLSYRQLPRMEGARCREPEQRLHRIVGDSSPLHRPLWRPVA
mmetsp:Transcript_69402/g.144935  ORF Transcript_69402/g.144935 Transcript_69402/m.144935 type:complete len:222 (-) Transcript_69402:512-1177(-)